MVYEVVNRHIHVLHGDPHGIPFVVSVRLLFELRPHKDRRTTLALCVSYLQFVHPAIFRPPFNRVHRGQMPDRTGSAFGSSGLSLRDSATLRATGFCASVDSPSRERMYSVSPMPASSAARRIDRSWSSDTRNWITRLVMTRPLCHDKQRHDKPSCHDNCTQSCHDKSMCHDRGLGGLWGM